jgi:hypothetical protein
LTGDLHSLAALGLPRIAFVKQLDVITDGLVVITFDASEFLGDVYPIMIGHLHVTALHDYIHACDLLALSSRTSATPGHSDDARTAGGTVRLITRPPAPKSWLSRLLLSQQRQC